MRRALLALVMLIGRPAWADDVYGPPISEGSTGVFWVSICDETYTVADATNCPNGGALVTYSDLSGIQYRIDNRACRSNYELKGDTSVSATANPVKITVPASVMLTVGRCSATKNTCCVATAECPSGETCEKPKDPEDQLNVLTMVWTYSGGTGTKRIPFYVRNNEFWPFP